MKFKNWLMREAGQLTLQGGSQNIVAMLHGQPSLFKGVLMIDPRFEFHNIPHPDPSKRKFLGDTAFSLPLVNPTGRGFGYIVSTRAGDRAGLSGMGFLSPEPQGVVAPLNWADHALIINAQGEDLISGKDFKTYGGEVELPQQLRQLATQNYEKLQVP